MKISIIGCGWLGLSLGASLVEAGHVVLGSTTRSSKFDDLSAVGIEPFLLKMDPMPVGEAFHPLFKSDLVIINIPPGRRKNPPEFYEEQVKYLKYLINQYQVPRVMFVSSTSYYPSTGGIVSEDTPYDFNNGSGKAVVQGEKQISQIDGSLTILRCGGLMGGDRIPGRWFAGKSTTGAETPVNYIHRDDVIGFIPFLLEQPENTDNRLFNLVAPLHPKRKEVHMAMAQKYGFEAPLWQDPAIIPHKIVESNLPEDFTFLRPNPLEF